MYVALKHSAILSLDQWDKPNLTVLKAHIISAFKTSVFTTKLLIEVWLDVVVVCVVSLIEDGLDFPKTVHFLRFFYVF